MVKTSSAKKVSLRLRIAVLAKQVSTLVDIIGGVRGQINNINKVLMGPVFAVQLLIDKGVITSEELQAKQKELLREASLAQSQEPETEAETIAAE